jgi:L-seryl-tRNA(Ser) seleniumtransferase
MTAKPRSGNSVLSALPSVDDLLRSETGNRLSEEVGRQRLTELARSVIDAIRSDLRSGVIDGNVSKTDLLDEAVSQLSDLWQRMRSAGMRRVINATGVVIHTNLGRAPLSEEAKKALVNAAGYCSVEYDVMTGERGRRGQRVEDMICQLTGADGALVVNNCAAAAYLVLTTFASGREVIISRGELVEIGGEFRVPDVLARSGATLKEVGTTNRTKLADYEKAISERTAVILKVHPSNYRIVGFTTAPALSELADLAHRKNILIYEDAGSGAVGDLSAVGLDDEPVISESLKAGADAVTFSGDKLLGGPQAGIVVGKRSYIETLRKDPLYRALRVSKLIYAALEATLEAHLRGTAFRDVPVLRMLSMRRQELEQRCQRLIDELANSSLTAEIVPGRSAVGGGAAPTTQLDSALIALDHAALSADELERKLRLASVPVITRITEDRVTIDLRTVSENEEPELLAALRAL